MKMTLCRYCKEEVAWGDLESHQASRQECPLAEGDWVMIDDTTEPLQIRSFAHSDSGLLGKATYANLENGRWIRVQRLVRV